MIKELKVCTEGITSDSYTTKYLSTSFKVSGRLDAEYYQPKYDGYLSALEQFETTKIPNEFDVLKNSGTNYAEGVSDVGVIKTKQLTNSGVNTDGIESYFTHETCIENKSTLVVNNDVVFASMGVGSLGKVSLFSYDGDKPFVTDSTLRIYRAKKNTHMFYLRCCAYSYSLQSVKNLSIGMLSGVLASSTSTTMILPRFLSLFWMEKFRKILPRKCRTPLLFAVNLSNYLNMQNRLLKWPLSREKMLRWYG